MKTLLLIIGCALILPLLLLWLFGERWPPIMPSTRRLLREGGVRRVLNGDFFHAYVYSRWSNQYIGLAVNRLFPRLSPSPGDRRWADRYHGKVLTPRQAGGRRRVVGHRARRSHVDSFPTASAGDVAPCSMNRSLAAVGYASWATSAAT